MSSVHDTDDQSTEDDLVDDELAPRERLSWPRLGIALATVAVIGGAIAFGVRETSSSEPATTKSWSIPYVDVTLTPTYEFQNPQSNPARDIALAFVVADPEEPCTPSWGGAYSMDGASENLELDRRIAQLRAAGGDIMISFGGQANDELAFACTDETKLTEAYRDVVTRYDAQAIDLDIENADLADLPSIERRARAITTVQKERTAAGDALAVWFTLPVATTGFTDDGVALVTSTLAGGVDLTGVNAMTMNFSDAAHPTEDMLAATKSALAASATQIADVYRGQGVSLDEAQRWGHLGATPMIGQNDVEGEVFTVDDASGLAEFATSKGLGRVSIWSLNRDAGCNATFADVIVLSNTCSSVEQEPLDFANVFTLLTGRAAYLPKTAAVTVPSPQQAVDDPATSPYPIWRPDAEYREGYKIVRGGQVYQAKWYTLGQDPSAAVPNPSEWPWSLVGPVGPNDVAFAPVTLAPGTHPEWEHDHLYAKGDTILFNGLPFEARWPNQGEAPSTLFPVGPDAAWNHLTKVPGEPDTP